MDEETKREVLLRALTELLRTPAANDNAGTMVAPPLDDATAIESAPLPEEDEDEFRQGG